MQAQACKGHHLDAGRAVWCAWGCKNYLAQVDMHMPVVLTSWLAGDEYSLSTRSKACTPAASPRALHHPAPQPLRRPLQLPPLRAGPQSWLWPSLHTCLREPLNCTRGPLLQYTTSLLRGSCMHTGRSALAREARKDRQWSTLW